MRWAVGVNLPEILNSQCSHSKPYAQRTAEDLPLDNLIQVVAHIRDHIGLGRRAIDLSLEALQHLYPRVRGLATRQKRWREIEARLLLIDDIGDVPTDKSKQDLIRVWTEAMSGVAKLVQIDPEAARFISIRDYLADKDNLVALLKKGDGASFRAANDQLRREVQFESSRVYNALYSLSHDILKILQLLKFWLAELT
jgi:hypothetical protein